MSKPNGTYSHEADLPSLPVPALTETLDKFLESVKPFLNADVSVGPKMAAERAWCGRPAFIFPRLRGACRSWSIPRRLLVISRPAWA